MPAAKKAPTPPKVGSPAHPGPVGADAAPSLYAGASLGAPRFEEKIHGSNAAYLDAVGKAPVTDQLTVLGRLGIAHVNVDTPQADDSGNGLKLGVGAQYAITRDVAVLGEVERYRPSVFGDKPDIDQFTVGVRYGF